METPRYVPQEERFSTPEEELAYLRARLEEKEKELARGGTDDKEEAVRESLKEYAAKPAHDVLHEEYRLSENEIQKLKLDLEPEEHDDKVSELLGILQEKGIKNALSVAESLKDPHVDDDFHRALVQYVKEGHQASGLNEKAPLYRALKMTLYEITLPQASEKAEERDLKTLVSSMEQLYAGLLTAGGASGSRKEHYTAELAVKHVGEEISFFFAVPDAKRGIFKKQVLSLFPRARIEEVKDDYNIFNAEGVSLGSRAKNTSQAIFPIKTFEEFDHDPLSVLLNAFSKLAEVGEGASIQFVFKQSTEDLHARYKNVIKEIEKGTPVKEAINFSFTKDLFKTAKELFVEKKKDENESSQLNSTAIENIQKKITSPIVLTDIRVVVSAPDQVRAKEILHTIESAFSQFENTHGNKIEFQELKGKDLSRFFHAFSFRQFSESKALPLNLHELTSLVHFPVRNLEGAREIKESRAVTAPAPIDMPKNGITLGINKHRGHELQIHFADQDRLRHMYVIGQTGTGKSVLLTNMILQDIKNGDGCCFIDPHGSDVQYILANVPPERYEDVIYFDPSYLERPIALNMLEYDPRFPEQKTFVINELLGIFNKLFDMKTAGGPMFEQYFRNATGLVMEDPSSGNTLLDISRVLADANFRKMKLERSNNYIVNQFWNEIAGKAGGEASLENIVPYITSKFDGFLSNDYMRPIIAQESSSLNFRDIMDSRKILLVNLSKGRLGDINANLIGLIIVGKLLMAALSRVDSLGKDMAPFYLYIDEFQNVTTDSISTILSEARKYKLSLTAAHQFVKQLDEKIRDAVFGNVGSMAVFRVSPEDAEVFEKQLGPVFETRDISNIPNWNAYIKMLANGVPVKPFSIATLPPPEGSTEHLDALKELSYLKYGRARAEVEREVKAKYEAVKKQPDTIERNPFI